MSLLMKGISKLSQLEIDIDKDWNLKGISNIRAVADGMDIGHIVQHNGVKLGTLAPSVASYVLTSQGPGKLVLWTPGGTYLDRFFSVLIDMSKSTQKPFAPDEVKAILAPLATPYGIEGRVNPGWFRTQQPAISLPKSLQDPFTPDDSKAITPTADTEIEVIQPVNGAVADDGGVQTNETTQAKSGLTRDQYYTSGEDAAQGMSASNYWEAQTFTTALAQRVRGVNLRLYRSGLPGTVTVAIKAVDGSNHPTGPDLCSGTFNSNSLRGTQRPEAEWVYIPFTTGVLLNNATRYAIVVRAATGTLYWCDDQTSPTYANGNREYSTNSGTSWTADTAKDYMFEVYYTLDDMTLLPASLAVGDAYYFGYDVKFRKLILDIGIAGAGTYALVWEYSRGGSAWVSLVDLTDGTDCFRNAWEHNVEHTAQGDWSTDNVAGITMYWIRARVTDAGAGYSQPKGSYAKVAVQY